MRDQIKAILRECPDHSVNQAGPLWQLRAGRHSGAREDGISLAQDLIAKWRSDPGPLTQVTAPPEPAPATDYDAIIADLKAQLAAKPAFKPHAEPEPVEIPDFLKAPEAPPADLADLFDPADTVPESNEKLLVRLREVLGLIGLAEDAGGRAAPELYRRKDRLESGIRWNRGRSAEAI